MIDIQIPKDIREYEPKLFGSLTIKQCVCLLAAAGIEAASVAFQTKVLGFAHGSFLPALPLAVFPILYGWGKPVFHMEASDYIREVLLPSLVMPRLRPYKTMNYYDIYLDDEQEGPKRQEKSRTKKKSRAETAPEFRPYQ